MTFLSAIPFLKEFIKWLRNTELIDYLKNENHKKDDIINAKDKHIAKLHRRIKKAENL